jgi:hypothetical protein
MTTNITCVHLDYFESHFEEYITLPKTKLNTSLFLSAYDEYVLSLYLKLCFRYTFGILKTTEKYIGEFIIHTTMYTVACNLKKIGNSFPEFIEYLKQHSSKKSLFGEPTVYILENVHSLSISKQTILHNTVEKNRNSIFVLTSYNTNRVYTALLNTIVQLKIPSLDVHKTIQKLCKESSIEYEKKHISYIIEHCKSKIYPTLLALDNPSYINIIHTEYMNLFSIIKKVKIMDSFMTSVRTTMYKLIVFNIPHSQLCKQLLKSIMTKYKKQPSILLTMCNVVSRLEHDLIFSSKPIQHYEYCFLTLFELVHNL